MTDESRCLKCGTPLTRDAREGVCPKCLLEQGLRSQGEDESTESPSPPVLTEKPGTVIGRYKLLQQIGQGAMGTVWMAEQTEPVRRTVALKVIKPGMDSAEVLARFEVERQALALMDHPNIARVLDAGATPNGRPYFVMDLVKGMPLIRFCDEEQLAVRERLELFIQVCQAVQHAHQKGIIHRDLKPSNVLVALYDGKPVPKVIDFGLAKATGQPLTARTLVTEFGAVLGTLQYMSPEQAELNQLDIDTRSDIYSLGVLLYELLTGTTPLTREALKQTALDELLKRIREEEPPRPSQRLSTSRERLPAISAQRRLEPEKLTKVVRGELDWIVMAALEKDRARRYETASSLALDVQHYLNDEPVTRGPPTVRYRARKFVRKHRMEVAVAAGFVALLTAASVISTALALWANQQRARADRLAKTESAARIEADAQKTLAIDLLNQIHLRRSEDFFLADDSASAVACLASVLRRDMSNHVAAASLLSTLTLRNFSLPLTEPLRYWGRVNSAQFSSDGRRVVTAWDIFGYWGCARLWDAQTGKPLTEPLWHEGPVHSAQFSPDGRWVVTASNDKTARVWDAQTGKPLTEPLRHEGPVHSAQFSPDGQRIVTACGAWQFGYARVWDALTGKPLAEPLRDEGPVYSAQFSPDGLRVVTACYAMARVWDAQTGKPLTDPRRLKASFFRFSPNLLAIPPEMTQMASTNKVVATWVSQPLMPAPPWFPELAESVVGRRLTGDGAFGPVKAEEFLKLKKQLLSSTETNYYAQWAKWFLSDPSTRTISPFSTDRLTWKIVPKETPPGEAAVTVPEYVRRRIEENTLESLREAVIVSPTNGLAFARLAKQVLAQSDNDNPRRLGEADFLSRYAVKLSPQDAEVRAIRAEILKQIGTLPKQP